MKNDDQQAPTEKDPFNLSDEQQAVISDINALKNVLITGPAGTGKSHLLKAIRAMFRENMIRLAVTGSTGIAAVNVKGVTLHSWAGLAIDDSLSPAKMALRITGIPRAYENLTEINHLAIDEVSMISGRLFQKMDAIFRKIRERPDEPFGGMQLILFGDFLQLPPVSKKRDDPEPFAFESKAWQDAEIQTHSLTKIFRQEDKDFATALNDIRRGELTMEAREILNERYHAKPPKEDFEPVILHTHNAGADNINVKRLAEIDAKEKQFLSLDNGTDRGRKLLEKCTFPSELRIKVGAQVMLCINLDQQLGLVNGSIGVVEEMDGHSVIVKFANGITEEIEPATWEVRENEKPIATRKQIPLRLAWAITVHKSQGMTLDQVQVHLRNAFEYGQAYVALSRARTKEGLFIANGNRHSIKAHPTAVQFYNSNAKAK